MSDLLNDLRFFDPDDSFSVGYGRLPHWSQAGTVAFITWRTKDSMPKPVVQRWIEERNALLAEHDLNAGGDWRKSLAELPTREALRIKWMLSDLFDGHLDACHGACVLKQPSLGQIVADSLLKFDEDRYVLTDFVVMPNHVHVMGAFKDEDALRNQVSGWKRFQARKINAEIGDTGHFWQPEDFDHLVRSLAQFEYYRRYIADNPILAGLKAGEFVHWSRQS